MFRIYVLTALAIVIIAVVSWPAHAKEATPAKCDVKQKFYDESHMAYDAAFAKEYNLPQENVTEMPEDLRFIEMIIRTENGKPVCHLNMALKNDPKFKFPKEDYVERRFDSQIRAHLNFLPKRTAAEIFDRTLWLELGEMIGGTVWQGAGMTFIRDLYLHDNWAFIAAQTGCSSQYTGDNGFLQVQRSDFQGTREDLIANPKEPSRFYHAIALPESWREKVRPSLKKISVTERDASKCRYEHRRESNLKSGE